MYGATIGQDGHPSVLVFSLSSCWCLCPVASGGALNDKLPGWSTARSLAKSVVAVAGSLRGCNLKPCCRTGLDDLVALLRCLAIVELTVVAWKDLVVLDLPKNWRRDYNRVPHSLAFFGQTVDWWRHAEYKSGQKELWVTTGASARALQIPSPSCVFCSLRTTWRLLEDTTWLSFEEKVFNCPFPSVHFLSVICARPGQLCIFRLCRSAYKIPYKCNQSLIPPCQRLCTSLVPNYREWEELLLLATFTRTTALTARF